MDENQQSTRYVTPDERVVLAKQLLELFASGPFDKPMNLLLATEGVAITAVALLDSFLRDEPPNPELLSQARRRRDILRAEIGTRDDRGLLDEVKNL
jgi:hypothetical protein